MSETVRYEVDDRIATLTLDHPELFNASSTGRRPPTWASSGRPSPGTTWTTGSRTWHGASPASPRNQLMMQKLAVNQAYENMGLATTQLFATLFDGMARHTPEGVAFTERCEEVGFKQAVAERDAGELFD